MKISNGNWLINDGLEIISPLQVADVDVSPCGGQVTIYAAPHTQCDQRDSSVNSPLLKIVVNSPREGILGVRYIHHEGARPRGPEFTLNKEEQRKEPMKVVNDDRHVLITSGELSVEFLKGKEWMINYYLKGKRITGSEPKNSGHITKVLENGKRTYMFERLDLDVGTCVYGLGERFTEFVKNGQHVETWNRDGGTSTEQAYKNVPFYLTNKGYGVFVDHPEAVDFEVGSEKVSKVQFSVRSEYLQYYVIAGPKPKQVLDRYTALTGRPALPPAWTFGLWLTTSFTTEYDEPTVSSFIDGFAERKIPLHTFHFDCFWMKGYEWVNLTWDPETFPDPSAMLKRLKAKGLHICLWINPYVAQKSPMFAEGMQKGYLLTNLDGDVWQWDLWQAGNAIIDFTNPDAKKWYQGKLRALLDQGVDSFKTDFGERIPTDVKWHNGADAMKMHNYYSYLFNEVVWQVLVAARGEGEACVFARSGTVGSQTMPVHWGGDCYANYPSMAESLRGGLSIGCSGFGFWSHDIGGFENTAPAHVYKRWCAFGLLSSHSRLHGSKSYRVPWVFDEESCDVVRHFVQWKCAMMPYLYGAAVQANKTGTPMMRAMVIEFPDDPVCAKLDTQYMLGDDVLVAPVFSETGDVEFYLPDTSAGSGSWVNVESKGTTSTSTDAEEEAQLWTHLYDNSTRRGGRYYKENYDVFSLPVYVRPGSVIPLGLNREVPDYDYTDKVEFHVYQLADKEMAHVVVPNKDGREGGEYTVTRVGDDYAVTVEGTIRNFTTVVHQHGKVFRGEGESFSAKW